MSQAIQQNSRATYSGFLRLVEDEGTRVVLTLGGGFVPGICGNVALLEVLEELGVAERVEEVWGASAGAIAGAGWASGCSIEEMLAALRSLQSRRAVDFRWGRLLLSILLRPFGARLPDGLVGGRYFEQTLRRALKVQTFEECCVPFRALAAHSVELRSHVFRQGPLVPAVMASMCLPGILAPPEGLGEERLLLYDGGMLEKTPLLAPIAEHFRLGTGRPLLLVGTHFLNRAWRRPARGFLNRFILGNGLSQDLLWTYQAREARAREGVQILLVDIESDEPDLFDFTRLDLHYRQARECIERTLRNDLLPLALSST